MYELDNLPVDTINVLPADGLEALTEGHGMTEVAASSSGPVPSCDHAEFDDES